MRPADAVSRRLARLNPTVYLRLEGLAELVIAVLSYRYLHATAPSAPGWSLFALMFLLPDVAMLGYLRGSAIGALAYNVAHAQLAPVVMLLVAYVSGDTIWASLALIWLAHIGFDRAAGYGLKHATAFGQTHLGPIGRNAAAHRRANSGARLAV